ncbi:cell wall hydrolase [Sphingomonas hankookensis]|uniref:Cell wall hydrolase n=1 Tax=Sphingomonas hengshuiensis TaxID=1609977 RepID=A0A2W4ZAM4_9SPHN|nr:MAG: cell wall hydrolase [Sphingomonas hengshuiensis]
MNKRWSVLVLWSLTAASGVASAHVAMNTSPELPVVQPAPVAPSPAPVTFAASAPVVQELPAEAAGVVADEAADELADLDKSEVECVAKVVVHEAGNQPHKGQLAVAQVIRARMKSGRFAKSACGVVKQRGQFFNVDAYNPPRNNGRWSTAVDIAKRTLSGKGEDVAPGALFFHSAGASFPKRTRVAQIADHTFYR